MTEPVGPALARQRLYLHLHSLREELHLPAADVAKQMHWSPSKLNRIENGKVTIQPLEVKAVLEHYGVTDQDEIDRWVQLSIASRQRMWWRDEKFDEDYLTFVAFENDASHLYGYHATFVSGLLQTEDYARAVTSAVLRTTVADSRVAEVVAVRMKRQETLLRRLAGKHPPTVSLAIDEAVLRRSVGGDEVMAGQLDHLLKISERPTVNLTVLPLRLGAHAGLGGTFELLTFSEASDLDVVFIETTAEDYLLTDVDNTTIFHGIINELLASGLSGDDASRAIRDARESLTR
jgi:transcriptional regulator with XRE-family HTH domain